MRRCHVTSGQETANASYAESVKDCRTDTSSPVGNMQHGGRRRTVTASALDAIFATSSNQRFSPIGGSHGTGRRPTTILSESPTRLGSFPPMRSKRLRLTTNRRGRNYDSYREDIFNRLYLVHFRLYRILGI